MKMSDYISSVGKGVGNQVPSDATEIIQVFHRAIQNVIISQ